MCIRDRDQAKHRLLISPNFKSTGTSYTDKINTMFLELSKTISATIKQIQIRVTQRITGQRSLEGIRNALLQDIQRVTDELKTSLQNYADTKENENEFHLLVHSFVEKYLYFHEKIVPALNKDYTEDNTSVMTEFPYADLATTIEKLKDDWLVRLKKIEADINAKIPQRQIDLKDGNSVLSTYCKERTFKQGSQAMRFNEATETLYFARNHLVSLDLSSISEMINAPNVEPRVIRTYLEPVNVLEIHPHNRFLVVSKREFSLECWDLHANKCRGIVSQARGGIIGFFYLGATHLSVNSCWDASTMIGNVNSKKIVKRIKGKTGLRLWSLLRVKTERLGQKVVAGVDNAIGFVSLVKPGDVSVFTKEDTGFVFALAWMEDRGQLAAGGSDKVIRIFDLERRQLVCKLIGHSRPVLCLRYMCGLGRVVSGSQDHTVKIWNLGRRTCEQTLAGHPSSVLNIEYWAKTRKIVSESAEIIYVWAMSGVETNLSLDTF
eukprot:TRINITY_DN2045_c0_g2_i1.p1 TRINITY_DN2045_c0_g2~~TRINITY_DN2045_c0_g2_i1.p1  ORF type:complete len:492 (+),score=67.24 TRINITY_DN2045_c0_g2_i1:64-1539(+)